jgi:AcrR family transcriptional regulator
MQEKRDRRFKEVLAAAAHTFRLRGYEAATMQDIASQLGVRPAALYHYAASKEHLLEEICQLVGTHYNQSLAEIVSGGASAPEMLQRAIAMHLHPDWFNHAGAFAFYRGNLSKSVKHRLGLIAKQNLELWAQIMRAGVSEKSLKPDLDCELAARLILAMCNGSIGMLEGMSRSKIDAVCHKIASYWLAGLQAEREERVGSASPAPAAAGADADRDSGLARSVAKVV